MLPIAALVIKRKETVILRGSPTFAVPENSIILHADEAKQ